MNIVQFEIIFYVYNFEGRSCYLSRELNSSIDDGSNIYDLLGKEGRSG